MVLPEKIPRRPSSPITPESTGPGPVVKDEKVIAKNSQRDERMGAEGLAPREFES